jgi:transposase-like protein
MSQPSIQEGSNKAKRARYTFAQKVDVMAKLKEAGANISTVSRATGINYNTVQSWKKNEEKIWNAAEAGAKNAKSKQKDVLPSLTKMPQSNRSSGLWTTVVHMDRRLKIPVGKLDVNFCLRTAPRSINLWMQESLLG